jgi:hypothetical protein
VSAQEEVPIIPSITINVPDALGLTATLTNVYAYYYDRIRDLPERFSTRDVATVFTLAPGGTVTFNQDVVIRARCDLGDGDLNLLISAGETISFPIVDPDIYWRFSVEGHHFLIDILNGAVRSDTSVDVGDWQEQVRREELTFVWFDLFTPSEWRPVFTFATSEWERDWNRQQNALLIQNISADAETAPPVYAPAAPATTADITVLVNGVEMIFTNPPLVRYGFAFFQVDDILEALADSIYWDSATRTVSGRLGNNLVEVQVDDMIYIINGTALNSPPELAPFVEGGLIYVYIDFIIEGLGLSASWDGVTRTFSVTN